jgi:hypothetical protein
MYLCSGNKYYHTSNEVKNRNPQMGGWNIMQKRNMEAYYNDEKRTKHIF